MKYHLTRHCTCIRTTMKLLKLISLSCIILYGNGQHVHRYSSLGGQNLGSYGYGDSGLGLHQNLHDNHGLSHHGIHNDLVENNHGHSSHHSLGSHGSQSAHGGHQGHVKKYHDQGSYSREKKYGYEKAYGYEKESKHHDKGGDAHSFGDNYNHHSHHNHHKLGSQAGGAHALNRKNHRHGGHSYGQHGKVLDRFRHLRDNHGQWNKYRPKYYSLNNVGGFGKGYMSPIGGFRYRNFDHLNRFPKWRYIGGLMNLGGFRRYNLNPLEYRGLNNYGDGLDYHDDELDVDELDGHSNDPEIDELVVKAKTLGEPVGLSGLGGGLGQNGHHYYYSKHYSS